ncbi:uncharacterized protein LAJ45_05793 [Morchella importuna]|uniref:uncharacterized protein n=1 Tax=Morchella importuna TaxID=1174673 RepID=UPI001E8E9C5E|nr:uncharacterized protein LAJ45_05793 [Morchella importuna]KAH8150107.1 hypothetical protein LAJ45_05793 [Morchella importuna]
MFASRVSVTIPTSNIARTQDATLTSPPDPGETETWASVREAEKLRRKTVYSTLRGYNGSENPRMAGRGGQQQYPLKAPGVDPAWYIPWAQIAPGPNWNVAKPRTYKIPFWVDATKTVLPLWMFDSDGGLLDNLEWDDWGQGFTAEPYEVSWADGPGAGVEAEVEVEGEVVAVDGVVLIEEAVVEEVEESIEVEAVIEVAVTEAAAVEIEAELNTELEVIGVAEAAVTEAAEIEEVEEVVTEAGEVVTEAEGAVTEAEEAAIEVVAEEETEETEAAEAAEAVVLSKKILGQLVELFCSFTKGVPTTA